jgi:hypothetical protein
MDKLLNLSFKTGQSIKSLVSNRELLFDPFDKAISRINYKPDFFKYDLQSETVVSLLKLGKAKTWEECCAERALNLLKLDYENYWFAYSGGIDSTGMLTSILKFWPAKELSRVSVVLTHHSVEENPFFFDKYIVRFNLINTLRPLSQMLLKSNALMVTGELGDQLFGSDILGAGSRHYGDEILAKNYQDVAPQIIEAYIGTKGPGKSIFEHFHPIVEEAPFPIKTAHDFFWWLNFSQKWQHVKFRFIESTDWDLRAQYSSHILHFYDSPGFQNWSLQNHDLKIRDTWKSYKFIAKEYIADFTKDMSQLNLTKIQSLEKTYVVDEKRIGVDSNYRPISSYEELKYYVR